ncbi:MAG: hypothetical protein K2G94_03455 [Muribaculaceae bacterium]|nr:hypothetical protein [Muribaculaceae bacterium]
MEIEFQIHGVLDGGHNCWKSGKDDDVDYYKSFYSKREETTLFTVEVMKRQYGVCSFYNLLIYNDIVAKIRRPGSYFGISVRIDGGFCLDVKGMYSILDNLFQKMVVGRLLTPMPDGKLRQTVSGSFSEEDAYLREIESQFQAMANAFFSPMDLVAISASNVSLPQKQTLNPLDVNPDIVKRLFDRRIKIFLSPDYPTNAFNNSVQKAESELAAAKQSIVEIQRKADDTIAQERANANKRISDINAQLQSLQDESSSKSRFLSDFDERIRTLQHQNDELKTRLDATSRDSEIITLLKDVQVPVNKLSALLEKRLNGPKALPRNEKSHNKPTTPNRQAKGPILHKSGLKQGLVAISGLAIVIIVVIALFRSCSADEPAKQITSSEEAVTTVEATKKDSGIIAQQNIDYSESFYIDIADLKEKTLTAGKSYSFSIKQKTNSKSNTGIPAEGTWHILINDTTIACEKDKWEATTDSLVKILYMSNGNIILERSITITK